MKRSVRHVRRKPARLLTLTGMGVVIAAFFAAAATSGQATHFEVIAPTTATAGTEFNVTVRALDSNGNPDQSYKDNHTLFYTGPSIALNGKTADYLNPVPFDKGVASVPITLFRAETTDLTVSDGGILPGTSGSIIVSPGPPAELTFTQDPPVWVQKSPESFPAQVLVEDDWKNVVPDEPVSIALNKHTLTCTPSTCIDNTDTSGLADFSLSVAKDSIGYKLVASAGSPSVTADSTGFSVADSLANCTGGVCNQNGSDDLADPTTASTSVSGVISGDQLALSVDDSLDIPLDVISLCSGFQAQVGSGFVFEAVQTPGSDNDRPSWAITATVDKDALIDTNRGAPNYEMCLGTINILPGTHTAGCVPNPPTGTPFSTSESWLAKGGLCATFDPGTGKFWGSMPNAASNQKTCSNPNPVRSPVVLSKNKTGAGNLVIKLCVPYPWDGWGSPG